MLVVWLADGRRHGCSKGVLGLWFGVSGCLIERCMCNPGKIEVRGCVFVLLTVFVGVVKSLSVLLVWGGGASTMFNLYMPSTAGSTVLRMLLRGSQGATQKHGL